MSESTCATCKWWGGISDHFAATGQTIFDDDTSRSTILAPCRIRAPHHDWTFTQENDWCGEHIPKEKRDE